MMKVPVALFALVVLLTASMPLSAGGVPRQAHRYERDLIHETRFVWGIDAPTSTMAGQINQESEWRPQARSAYAAGLAQFTPQTAKWISGAYRLGSADPFDPSWAIRALVRYDHLLWRNVHPYDSNCDRWEFALAGYNGGAGYVRRRQSLSGAPGSWRATGHINPGISAANQLQNEQYPERIISRWQPMYVAAGWGPGVC